MSISFLRFRNFIVFTGDASGTSGGSVAGSFVNVEVPLEKFKFSAILSAALMY